MLCAAICSRGGKGEASGRLSSVRLPGSFRSDSFQRGQWTPGVRGTGPTGTPISHTQIQMAAGADGSEDRVCFWEIVTDHTRSQNSQENSTYFSFSVRSTRTGKEAYSFSGQDVCTAWGEIEKGVYRVTLVPIPEDEIVDPDADLGLHGWKLKVDDFDLGTRFYPLPPRRRR